VRVRARSFPSPRASRNAASANSAAGAESRASRWPPPRSTKRTRERGAGPARGRVAAAQCYTGRA
jgi:hypothetical protein